MQALFSTLGNALESNPFAGLSAALVWGMLSILLSPCHLASIPLAVGYIAGESCRNAGKTARLALLFAAGVVLTVLVAGLITSGAGRLAGDIGRTGFLVVGFLLILFGLVMAGVIEMPEIRMPSGGSKQRGPLGAVIAGVVIGLALGPCTFAFLGPLLAMSVSVQGSAPAYSTGLIVAFGVGHFLAIAGAGMSLGLVSKVLKWNEHSRGMTIIRFICGIAVIVAGLSVLYSKF